MIKVFTVDLSGNKSSETLQKDLNHIESMIDKKCRYEIISVMPSVEHFWEALVITRVVSI